MTRRLPPRSVRGRAVLGAGLGIAVFGVLIGLAAYLVVTQTALNSVSSALEARVVEVSDQLLEQAAADPSSVDLEALQGTSPTYLQVVTTTGDVLATTPSVEPGLDLCPMPLPEQNSEAVMSLAPQGSVGDYLGSVTVVEGSSPPLVVCAVTTMEPVARAQAAVLLAMAVALPLLILAVGLVVWLAVSRALSAVEDMRTQAEEMQSTEDGLLRVPETGDEVEGLGVTLNALLSRIHQRTRATRQFVADAGHELRNPLATLRVTLEFAQDADETALQDSVKDALKDLDRLEYLTQDLLQLARSDALDRPAHVTVIDLDSVAADTVAAQQRRRPDLDIVCDVTPTEIDGDRAALTGALLNLLDNAARHARHRVTVTLRPEGGQAVLAVDDDGEGVAAEDCERVFERFVRLDDARDRDEGGSGLGLAIVASVIQTHGGTVVALPRPGGHFVVTLPVTARHR